MASRRRRNIRSLSSSALIRPESESREVRIYTKSENLQATSTERVGVLSTEASPLTSDTQTIEKTIHGVLYSVKDLVDDALEFGNDWGVRGRVSVNARGNLGSLTRSEGRAKERDLVDNVGN